MEKLGSAYIQVIVYISRHPARNAVESQDIDTATTRRMTENNPSTLFGTNHIVIADFGFYPSRQPIRGPVVARDSVSLLRIWKDSIM